MKTLDAPSPHRIVWSSWPSAVPQLRPLEMPRRLRIPLSGGAVGPVAQVMVRPPGSDVLRGERLTLSPPEASHAPLSPATGRIVGTWRAMLTNGGAVPVVEVEPDVVAPHAGSDDVAAPGMPGAHGADDHPQLARTLEGIGPKDLPAWIERLRDAGVWAERRGSPDLTAQLHQALRRPVDTVLCSVLDNDAAVRLNGVMAARHPLELLAGVGLLARLTRANRTSALIEAGAPPQWWKRLRRVGRHCHVDVLALRNDYPQSDPTLLLYALLDRRLRPGRSPVEQGVLILDAAAAVAVGQVLLHEQPMLHVPLAVHDHARHEAHFLLCPVGTALEDALALGGIGVPQGIVLRSGDLLRDAVIPGDAVVGGGELVIHVTPQAAPLHPEPCIRCSWCIESCPVRIQPAGLLEAAQRRQMLLSERFGADACIECGVCSYVCPSRLPLLPAIRGLKRASVEANPDVVPETN
jgi:electron transport complex protein RnfC